MEGKVAIITGGTRGIGKGYAEILLRHRMKVCIAGRDQERGNATLEELRAQHGACWVMFFQCDVTKKDQLENLFKHTVATFGQLDIVVNHAGAVFESNWKAICDVNLTAVINGTMLGVKYMGKHNGGKGGVIINTSSISGLVGLDVAPHYSATRFAVIGFSRSMARVAEEFYGIRINVMCPSYVATEILEFTPENLKKGQLYGPSIEKRVARSQEELGPGLLSADEVAKLFMVLVNDESLHGQTMLVSTQGSGLVATPNNVKELLDLYIPNKV